MKERISFFLSAESFTTDEWGNFTVCTNSCGYSLKTGRTCSDECHVCFVNDSAVLNESNYLLYLK